MKDQEQYKYFAFISYNSHDTSWGKRLMDDMLIMQITKDTHLIVK